MAQGSRGPTAVNGEQANTAGNAVVGPGNRKKQKRRQKQAARLAAEQGLAHDDMPEGLSRQGSQQDDGAFHSRTTRPGTHFANADGEDLDQFEPAEGEDMYYTDEEGRIRQNSYDLGSDQTNGHASRPALGKKSKKKKKGKNALNDLPPPHSRATSTPMSATSSSQAPLPPPPPPPLSTSALRPSHGISRDRIWNTSTQEERERIKDFWLSLGEEDRRSLVKVEKEAVLRKMKEQQKHSCSCTVCGRKRTAIEEELEVLYDAYYEELEQYANHQQTRLEDGAPIMPPPGRFGPSLGRLPPDRMPPLMHPPQSSRGRIQELADDDEDEGDDEEYSDEEDEEEDYSDEEPEEPRGPAADFFNFGNSLTVQGGILTVADDLLKNDGKKFIEMMEQLAERRMQREEEAQYAAASGLAHQSMGMQHSHAGHNHGPLPDDEEYDDEEDEYDSQEEDEEFDDDEMDTMTEEQRMEEGRRMFQIFAARMFEQRVLTAYREKVARERQQKLLEELEEESRLDVQREAKKAREAQKRKDKKRQQKQAKEEEKARKEAEKAAEEAALRAIEEKKQEELRQKKEEQRRKKEAERKALEEERQRKEAEKQKRLQEERERQAEAERKQREQKEREKKKREEAKRREREEREAKEKEVKERKEREDKERKEREARAKAPKEAKDRAKKEEQNSHSTSQATHGASKRSQQPLSIPLPASLQPAPSSFPSPHPQVATPVIPKAPTPVRPRRASQQGSHASSPKTPQALLGSSQAPSPSITGPQQTGLGPVGPGGKAPNQPSQLQHPQSVSPMPSLGLPGGLHQPGPGLSNMLPLGSAGFPMSQAPMMAGLTRGLMGHDGPLFPHQQGPIGPPFRQYSNPNGMPPPPGINGARNMSQGRGLHMEGPPPGISNQISNVMGPSTVGNHYGMTRDTMPSHSHSRQQSATFEKPSFEIPAPSSQAQPIARPTPIQRPSSVAPQQRGEENRRTQTDVDDLSNHLGSSALLDDTDEPFAGDAADTRRGSAAPGAHRTPGLGFSSSPLFSEPSGSKMNSFGLGAQSGPRNQWGWGAPPTPFGAPDMSGTPPSSSAPGSGWANNNAFGIIGGPNRANASRPVSIRLMTCTACKQLASTNKSGFQTAQNILDRVNQLRPANEPSVHLKEVLDICETEGDAQNGGGYFTLDQDGKSPEQVLVKYEEESGGSFGGRSAFGPGPGEIGSPVPGNSMPAFGGPRPFSIPGLTSPSGF
ncbi:MAG: hypothetical protein M1819_004806 [Sarea resinae]|nr:MAG: hypothetical protein M1819_004806 [Sarea resinae]